MGGCGRRRRSREGVEGASNEGGSREGQVKKVGVEKEWGREGRKEMNERLREGEERVGGDGEGGGVWKFTFLYSCTASIVLCWSSSMAAYLNSRLCTCGMLYCCARATA